MVRRGLGFVVQESLAGLGYLGTFSLIFIVVFADAVTGQQRQQFVSNPKNQQVVEGSTSIIECEVANQRGRVQWAKDGFVLGFNRSIPYHHRYEMLGDGLDGKHHLRIVNASLKDDANFQCQVSPADGEDKPMVSTANLTVLLAPSSIKLASEGRDSVIEVNEGDQVTLDCVVRDAKPVANITWFKNEQEIKQDENRVDKVKESSLPKRHNIESRISIKLTARDDRSVYTCQGNHLALEKPIRASVTVSVLYPPGPPIITGYANGEILTSGEERVFTCVSKGGNPLGRVRWYRNHQILDTTDVHGDGQSVNEHRIVVGPLDNAATFSCEVHYKLSKRPLVSSIKTTVHFPPEKVEVSGPSKARVGDTVNITCLALNSNPPAKVSWVVNTKPYPVTATPTEEQSGSGGWHTVSRFGYVVPAVDRNIMFTCHATNDALGRTSVDTFTLSVLRPPQAPEIYGYNEGVGIRNGEEQDLSCIARGGNPPAYLQWFRNGVKIPSDKHSTADVSTAKITIVAEPHDNMAQLRCEAHNSAASRALSVSTVLTVYFPPSEVKITVEPGVLKAGTQGTLRCVAGPSNPPVRIAWYRGGFKLKGDYQEASETPNHGTSVTDILVVNFTSAHDELSYICEAQNPALQTKTSDSVILDVHYEPQFLATPPRTADVVEGDALILNLTATGNPSPLTYVWSRGGVPLAKAIIEKRLRNDFYDPRTTSSKARNVSSSSRISTDGPLLTIREASIGDTGRFELLVTNDQGPARASVYVNVQYGAWIKATSRTVSVPLGEDAPLECDVDGNPLVESMIKWIRPNYNFQRAVQNFQEKQTILKILKVDRNDTGTFTCSVSNGFGDKLAVANVTLIVEAKPIIKTPKLHSLAASKIGTTGRLECHAEGAPEVKFSWVKNGADPPLVADNGKYYNETVKTGLVTYVSFLEINRVTGRDYGLYECVASNKYGKAVTSVRFSDPTRPRPPLSLKVVNVTHDSVTLDWVPGFDGGVTQYFRIRYRAKGRRDPYSYADVYERGITSYTVAGLQRATQYYFSIMSRNEIGNSQYGAEFVTAITARHAPPTPVPSSNVGRELGAPLPALWVVILVLVAMALLALNVSAIVCIVKRRRKKRGTGAAKKFPGPPPKGVRREPPVPLTSVSSHSGFGSDLASSKGTANTMYAPSSYNDTVVGETLSSISEKSRESYSQDGSVGEYDEGMPVNTHNSAYLIDQIEPPPEYASRTPSSQPSSAPYDPTDDDYAEVLRRNAYNYQLGKGTLRGSSRGTHYSTSSSDSPRGYLSYSYTPSPTGGAPNGLAPPQYHVTQFCPAVTQESGCEPLSVQALESPRGRPTGGAFRALGLDDQPAPELGLEQHSIPSDPPSLTTDPHSITIDHAHLVEYARNGDLHAHAPTHTLSTFHPNPSPQSAYSEPELEGHLV